MSTPAPNEGSVTTVAELRKLTQGRVEPSVYVPARWVSIHVSRLLVRTPVTPNMVTAAWGGCLFGSSVLFGVGGYLAGLAAAGLILVAYVLDCVDGEIARLRGRGSDLGSTLEQMIHWTTNLAVLVGAAIGAFRQTGEPAYLVWGLVALLGDATFHFMYVSLRVAATPGGRYGLFARITRWQFYIMPLTTNILFIGAVFGRVDLALAVWAVWSNVAWLLGFSLFFKAQREIEPALAVLREALELTAQPAPDGGSTGANGTVAAPSAEP